MLNNKFTRTVDSTLIKNKLDSLSKALKESNANPDLATLESVIAEAVAALSAFYKDVSAPIFDPKDILPGDGPDPKDYNKNIQAIVDDLRTIFSELENIETLVLENFNYFISESSRLQRKMKSISSKLGDFILFSSSASNDLIFFTDTFNNFDRVELESSLLNSTQAEVSQAEGIVTLPVLRSPESLIKIDENPVINENSTGVKGNNFEIGAPRNDDLSAMLDNNPDTWFEYERVITPRQDDGTPLVLDITINLGETQIINFIRVNPNNFGTRTQIEIDKIETSANGSEFINIKDEVPIPGFEAIDEPNVFTLAPSTSKFSGQGLYSFTPREAKYVHLVLKQSSAYVINTLIGERLRYAIGIRDIEVRAQQYQTEGQFVSKPFQSFDEIRKVSIDTGQNPTEESELVSIAHEVSPDNGITWHEIRPQAFTGITDEVNEIPEVLDFNSGLPGSVTTDAPVNSVRYRATLTRNPEAFKEGASNLKQITKFTTELHQVPSTSPFNIELENSPVRGSVCLVDPHFGSRGIDDLRYEFATGNSSVQIHRIPFTDIKLDKDKAVIASGVKAVTETSPIQLYINGEKWTQVAQGGLSQSSARDKVYEVDHDRGIIRTGDGRNGKAPVAGSNVALAFTPERLFPESVEEGHKAKLSFPTNNDVQSATVRRFEELRETNETLEKSAKRFNLSHKNIVEGSVKFTQGATAFTNEVNDEYSVQSAGDYYIDYESGLLVSFSTTNANTDTGISYTYRPITILNDNEWYYIDDPSCETAELVIQDSAWLTIPVTEEPVPTGVKKFSLDHFNIEQGTLNFVVPSGVTDPFTDEVEFVDGRTEILGLLEATEPVPNGILTSSGIHQFTLSLVATDLNVHPIVFSNQDVFQEDVTGIKGSPTEVGEYLVAGDNRTVKVHINQEVTKPGTVTYFYSDPTKDPSGTYSVNYQLGDVYTFETIPDPGIEAEYQYSHYDISYPISRTVSTEDYSVDTEEATITIRDREILKRSQIPAGSKNVLGTRNTYQVLYNYVDKSRSNIDQLEPHFTPVLKDYTIKVLTKGRIV